MGDYLMILISDYINDYLYTYIAHKLITIKNECNGNSAK